MPVKRINPHKIEALHIWPNVGFKAMSIDVFSPTDQQQWFNTKLTGVNCSVEAKAYIVGICFEFSKSTNNDLSNRSIVLEYAEAKSALSFVRFQRLGDFILWVNIFYLPHFKYNKQVAENIGRLSYFKCYKLLNGQWKVFEELADSLPIIVDGLGYK